ncbi:MAG: flagellar basal body P-ring formation protein FlgA [Chlorobi bacterium]|nr:flagellar basal body P-ring formation protein FlgA [Chlorobiota bacterium]
MYKNLFYILSLFLVIGARGYANSFDEYLKKEFKDYNSFSYEIMTLPRSIKSLDDKRLEIDEDRELRVRKGFAYVPALVKVGSAIKKCVVTLKVKLYRSVLVANRKIKKGEIFSPFDFRVEEKDVSTYGDQIVSEKDDIGNCRANVTIKKDDILIGRMVEAIPLIKRGDEVTVNARYGTVVATFPAIAREDGTKGKKIRVIRNDKRIFRVEVIDSKNVIIR